MVSTHARACARIPIFSPKMAETTPNACSLLINSVLTWCSFAKKTTPKLHHQAFSCVGHTQENCLFETTGWHWGSVLNSHEIPRLGIFVKCLRIIVKWLPTIVKWLRMIVKWLRMIVKWLRIIVKWLPAIVKWLRIRKLLVSAPTVSECVQLCSFGVSVSAVASILFCWPVSTCPVAGSCIL